VIKQAGNAFSALLTDEMPPFSERLTLPNRIRPDSRIADVEFFRGFEKVLNKLRSVFGKEVLGQVADGAVTQTAPGDCLACEGEEGEGGEIQHASHLAHVKAC